MIPKDTVRLYVGALALMLAFAAAALGQPVVSGSLPDADVGVAYPGHQLASGGTPPYSWTFTGTPPGWLSFNTDGSVSASGLPDAVGTFSFSAGVTDSSTPTPLTSNNQAFSITVNAALAITLASLPAGQQGAAYPSTSLAATGGTGSYTWSVFSGSLPTGLTLGANGSISSGPPTAAGTFGFTAQVADGITTARQGFSITINPPAPPPPSVTTTTVPQGEVTAPYSKTLTETGGTGPAFAWSLAGGSGPLPNGVSLSSAGVIGGTPTQAGTFPFSVQVTDSLSVTSAPQSLTLTVIAGPGINTGATLPSGPASVSYSQTLSASGGTGTGFTWTITAGTLPFGLSLSAGGAITGGPTATGTFHFTAKVTDSGGGSASRAFSLTITAGLTITTPSPLPPGEATAPYSQTLSAAGGTNTGFVWTVTSGSPPPGLSLVGNAITGAPTTTGLFAFTVKVTDSGSGSASQVFFLNITPGPSITTISPLPSGEATVQYSQSLSASGGTNTGFVWTLTAGSLPSGLSLAAGGVIFGAAAVTGAFHFTIQVTDSGGGNASQPFTLNILGGPSISTSATLPQGEVGAAYSQTLAATGGSGAGFVWSLAGTSSLPGGLSLSGGGVLSGTPTIAALGTSSFTVQVTDSANGTATQVMSLTIIAGPTITTAPTLPNGTVGVPFTTVTLAASGGTVPYTWSITAGFLPQGLTLNGNAGTISGIPAASGTSGFTIQVIDAKGVTATKGLSIVIAAGLTITTAPGLPSATIGVPYSASVSAAGGTPDYTWSVTTGSLPSGLTFSSTGSISGTPATAGTFQFTVQVTDSASVSATKQFTLTVAQTLAITTAGTLPSGSTGAPYSTALGVSGGTPPYTWAITSVAPLPSGLSLSASNGVITGTPTSTGTFIFTVQVKDANLLAASKPFSLTVVSGLTITTPSPLPPGAANTPYSQTLSAAGGTAPYTWILSQGTLPAGLTSNAAGTISGTPTTNGTSTFAFQVKDHNNATSTKQFSLTIGAGLVITSGAALPSGTLAQSYTPLALAAVGGTQPCCTWSVTSGSMPTGLSLSASGVITGTPTAAGAFSFTVLVKDSSGSVASQTFTISIIPPTLPQVNIAGVPQTSPAGQQIFFGVTLASVYPLDISGQITLSFQPDAVAPATDPGMQFSTGGATANFTIPANTTGAVFSPSSSSQIGLQTGTVSGTITLNFTLTAGGAELLSTPLERTITIPRSVPAVQSVKMVRNSNGLEIHIVGFSSSRDLAEADLTFTAAPGATLQTTSVTEPLTSVATKWYQSAGSAQYGSQFLLVLPFTASQGSVDAVGSVSVVLKNAQGNSPAASGTF
ncbi:MAG: Ig domain-containing protein [Acidobacteriia bacterium]|nr:Ig domain-containing protein [Terriglobia bacterium]